VIDLSGTAGLDAASAKALVQLCSALRLIGVRSMLAGLGARGALLLSSAEIALPPTAATVQDALAILERDIQQN
jgi:anti-anti-sigma regulatory factor